MFTVLQSPVETSLNCLLFLRVYYEKQYIRNRPLHNLAKALSILIHILEHRKSFIDTCKCLLHFLDVSVLTSASSSICCKLSFTSFVGNCLSLSNKSLKFSSSESISSSLLEVINGREASSILSLTSCCHWTPSIWALGSVQAVWVKLIETVAINWLNMVTFERG